MSVEGDRALRGVCTAPPPPADIGVLATPHTSQHRKHSRANQRTRANLPATPADLPATPASFPPRDFFLLARVVPVVLAIADLGVRPPADASSASTWPDARTQSTERMRSEKQERVN